MSFFSWNRLYVCMYARMMARFEAHNALLYPTLKEQQVFEISGPTFRRSHVKRVKAAEMDTARHLLRLYCEQVAAQLNTGGTLITNQLKANSANARNHKCSKSGTDRHLGKLAHAGLLLGIPADKDSPKVYQDSKVHPGAKGYGVMPLKKTGGRYSDYTLLIDPSLIPTAVLPKGVSFFALESFSTAQKAYIPPIKAQIESLALFQSEGNQRIKKLIQRAALFVDKSVEKPHISLEREIPGTKSAVGQPDFSDGNPKKEKKFPADAKALIAKNARILAGKSDIQSPGVFQKLFLNGHSLAAYAVLMVQLYVQKIALSSHKHYVSAEIERAKHAVIKLFLQYDPKDWEQLSSRLCMVIDHMAAWIKLDPAKHWVKPPSQWFDPNCTANIEGAEKHFLQRYEQIGRQMQQSRQLKSAISDQKAPIQLIKSPYYTLAKQLKKHLLRIHPSDRRLKSAALEKWANELRLCVDKDHIPFDSLCQTVDWLCLSRSPGAHFWRKEAGYGFGIRSARGLRRNFREMQFQRQQSIIQAAQRTKPAISA